MNNERHKVTLKSNCQSCNEKAVSGFSLIELMIAVLIIGIISSIAIPSYRSSVLKSKRSDGQTLLLDIAARMEKTMFANGSYTTDLKTLGYTLSSAVPSPEAYYKSSVLAATASCPIANCYVIRATPQGGQLEDGIMEITSTGIKRRDKNKNNSTTDTGEESWK